MASSLLTSFVVLAVLLSLAHAQWKGTLGGNVDRNNWRLNGRLAYQRRNTNFHLGGHYGRGGSWGVNAGFTWKFGRKRRSMDLEDDVTCGSCVHVVDSTYRLALNKIAKPGLVDYAILAGLSGVYSKQDEDVLSFDVVTVLREPSTFNSTDDKAFDIIAKRPACSAACLARVKTGTYLIGGSLLNGQMIVYDKIVHIVSSE